MTKEQKDFYYMEKKLKKPRKTVNRMLSNVKIINLTKRG